jgi:hypothetical protein
MEVSNTFMTQIFYPSHPLERRLGGSQTWTGYCEDDKNLFLFCWESSIYPTVLYVYKP